VTLGPILRDRIVILDGLKEGDSVATAGNFLIDSQMQLAGKPSLIDPVRAMARTRRQGPLAVETVAVATVGGESGRLLEELYAAYFQVQQTLAADAKPPVVAARTLHQAAGKLAHDPGLPEPASRLLSDLAAASQHLHHAELPEAREAFKAVSRAAVALAAHVRGEGARSDFSHFFCPMVPGGGDWLQAGGNLLNPYLGPAMLRCGEKVRILPAPQESDREPDSKAIDRGPKSTKEDA
jgi:Cu(I)/Ag(I) efflux system membrane fusion protein